MDRKLIRNVQVGGVWYRPGDTVPDDIAERITNPKAWEGDVPAKQAETTGSPVGQHPPFKGPGSNKDAWVAFAADNGVTGEWDSRDALVADLRSRGLIGRE